MNAYNQMLEQIDYVCNKLKQQPEEVQNKLTYRYSMYSATDREAMLVELAKLETAAKVVKQPKETNMIVVTVEDNGTRTVQNLDVDAVVVPQAKAPAKAVATKAEEELAEFGINVTVPLLREVAHEKYEALNNQSFINDWRALYAKGNRGAEMIGAMVVTANKGTMYFQVDVAFIGEPTPPATEAPAPSLLWTAEPQPTETPAPVAKAKTKAVAKAKTKAVAKTKTKAVSLTEEDVRDLKSLASLSSNLFAARGTVNHWLETNGFTKLGNGCKMAQVKEVAASIVANTYNGTKATTAKAPSAADIRKLAKEKGIDVSDFNFRSSVERAKAAALLGLA